MRNFNTLYANRYLYLLYSGIFGSLLLLNILTPLWGDDWWRSVGTSRFASIPEYIVNEYLTWGGRLSVLIVTFIALLQYPASLPVFAVVNSLIFCLLMLISSIFRVAVGRWPSKDPGDILTIFTIFACVWFLCEGFGEAILWKTGAVAYLWVITFSILIVNPFIELLVDGRGIKNNKKRLYILPFAALIIACGLENVSVTLAICMIFALLFSTIRSYRPPLWYWLVGLGHIIGTAILMSAPGNFIRYEQTEGLRLHERFNGLVEAIWFHFVQDVPVIYIYICYSV